MVSVTRPATWEDSTRIGNTRRIVRVGKRAFGPEDMLSAQIHASAVHGLRRERDRARYRVNRRLWPTDEREGRQ